MCDGGPDNPGLPFFTAREGGRNRTDRAKNTKGRSADGRHRRLPRHPEPAPQQPEAWVPPKRRPRREAAGGSIRRQTRYVRSVTSPKPAASRFPQPSRSGCNQPSGRPEFELSRDYIIFVPAMNAAPHITRPDDGLPMPRRLWAILAVAFGVSLSVIDSAIANVALPTIGLELGSRRPTRSGSSTPTSWPS